MKIKLYRKILLIQLGVLVTLIINYFATHQRGYKAIGGEFLFLPLSYIFYKSISYIVYRWKETNEYFERKESAVKYKNIYKEEVR